MASNPFGPFAGPGPFGGSLVGRRTYPGYRAPKPLQPLQTGSGTYNPLQPPDASQGGQGTHGGHYDPMQPPDARIPGGGKPPIKGPPGSPKQHTTPLDAQYFLNVAANRFRVNNAENALNQQSGYARTDLQNALSNLGRQQPLDNLHAEQGANARGGLFSTALGQQLGQLNQNYLTRQGQDSQAFERGEAGRQSTLQGLEGSVPLYNAGQYLAAVQRASLLAQKNPASGESTKPLVKGHGGGHGGHGGGGGRGGRGMPFGLMNRPGPRSIAQRGAFGIANRFGG